MIANCEVEKSSNLNGPKPVTYFSNIYDFLFDCGLHDKPSVPCYFKGVGDRWACIGLWELAR